MAMYKYFAWKYGFVLPTVHVFEDLSLSISGKSTRLMTVYMCIAPLHACCRLHHQFQQHDMAVGLPNLKTANIKKKQNISPNLMLAKFSCYMV